ncbi:DedA family protein [Vibrio profundum]|uniref:DedA family protein n=1 Tax=Vibrio profundum TaxID=2910247 RepID=UPI003D0CDA06
MIHIHDLIQSMKPLLEHYGYFALIVSVFFEGMGIPLPGQSVLITASIMSSENVMNLPMVMTIGWIACFCGNTAGYFIGYYFESWLAKKGYISEKKWQKIHSIIQKYGPICLVISRFVEGMKQFMPMACGMAKMSKRTFFIGNAMASTLWVLVFSLLVHYVFAHLSGVMRFYHHHQLTLWVACGVLLLAIVLLFIKRKKTSKASS